MERLTINRDINNKNLKKILEYQLRFYYANISKIVFEENCILIESEKAIDNNEIKEVIQDIVNKFSKTSVIEGQKRIFDSSIDNSSKEIQGEIDSRNREAFVKIAKFVIEKYLALDKDKEKIFKEKKYKVSRGLNAYNSDFIGLNSFFDETIRLYFTEIYGAEDIIVPSMIPSEYIDKSGYFETGCQHISFVAPITNNPTRFKEFQKNYFDVYREKRAYDYVKNPKYILNPALCLHCYPLLSRYVFNDKTDVVVTVSGLCFRDESGNLNNQERLHEFKMREVVFFSCDKKIKQYQKELIDFLYMLGKMIGQEYKIETANDMFFSDNAEKHLFSQLISDDKVELRIKYNKKNEFISVASVNKHHNHFSKPFNLKNSKGDFINTMCIGFGMDRLTLVVMDAFEKQGLKILKNSLLANLESI